MTGWLESIVGPDYAAALMWTIVALIVLLVLLILTRIARGFGVGTFVSGGRNRKARLAVMDATAIDSHRRLVLVRRDDVEHLILIGGPTDVVVEQNIRLIAPVRRPAGEDAHPRPTPQTATDQPPPRIQSPSPAPAPTPAPVPTPTPALSQPRGQTVSTSRPTPPPQPAAPRPAPVVSPSPPPSPSVRAGPRAPQAEPIAAPAPVLPQVAPPVAPAPPQVHASATTSRHNDMDEALLQELEASLDNAPASRQQPVNDPDATLDEEMSRLLSDLAGKR